MNAHRTEVLRLYRQMLRGSKRFQDYNFRSYALRRVRDGFREGKNASDAQVPQLMARAHHDLGVIERQSTISTMFSQPRHVLEARAAGDAGAAGNAGSTSA